MESNLDRRTFLTFSIVTLGWLLCCGKMPWKEKRRRRVFPPKSAIGATQQAGYDVTVDSGPFSSATGVLVTRVAGERVDYFYVDGQKVMGPGVSADAELSPGSHTIQWQSTAGPMVATVQA